MAVDAKLAAEIGANLAALGYGRAENATSMGELAEDFRSWVGVENLEDRVLEGDQIDRVVLEFLREKAAARS